MDGTAEDALRQIDEKGYMIPYQAGLSDAVELRNFGASADSATGKRLVKIGVNISTQTRTVEKWVVAEQD